MPITSVDVDRELIQEIKRLTGMKTDREVIHAALQKQLALANQNELLKRMATRVFTDEQLTPETTPYSL
jgi:Arc/MetJ family transcription regulator